MTSLLFRPTARIQRLRILDFIPALSGSSGSPCLVFKRQLRGSSYGDFRRNRRSTYYSSRTLLEKFVKLTRFDSSLIAKSPACDLKVRGSYFDEDNNVDRSRNRQVLHLLRSQGDASPPPPVSLTDKKDSGSKSEDPEEPNPLFHAHQDVVSEDDDNILEHVAKAKKAASSSLSSDFAEKIDSDKRDMYRNHQKSSMANVVSDASRSLEDPDLDSGIGSVLDEDLMAGSSSPVPLHVLFYGRSSHRLDSYSIMNNKGQQQTHVYLTDASSVEEAIAMFSDPRRGMDRMNNADPVGSFSIWQPKELDTLIQDESPDTGGLPDELTAGFKIYIPPHIAENPDNSLKSVFLVPTVMNKIFLEGERRADVELDASLIDDLERVGLCTEAGNIKVKDLRAYDIRLASRMGDVVCDGGIEGNMVVELNGDGDFIAKYLDGPAAMVTTESGDIHVWGECRCIRSHFFTRNGNILAQDLYNQNYMSIKDHGNVQTNLIEGSISAVVRIGNVNISIQTLLDHSTLHVTEGDIIVTVPRKPSFRINATAPATDIAPSLLNAGDLFVNDDGYETFTTTGVAPYNLAKAEAEKLDPQATSSGGLVNEDPKPKKKVVSFHETEPTLNMITNKGKITILVSMTEADKNAVEGYDSAS